MVAKRQKMTGCQYGEQLVEITTKKSTAGLISISCLLRSKSGSGYSLVGKCFHLTVRRASLKVNKALTVKSIPLENSDSIHPTNTNTAPVSEPFQIWF